MTFQDVLGNVPIFAKLDENGRRSMGGIGIVKSFAKSETIFLEGNEFRGFYVVLEGAVKIYKLSQE
jgi:CRP-like cAMP-binding protein